MEKIFVEYSNQSPKQKEESSKLMEILGEKDLRFRCIPLKNQADTPEIWFSLERSGPKYGYTLAAIENPSEIEDFEKYCAQIKKTQNPIY